MSLRDSIRPGAERRRAAFAGLGPRPSSRKKQRQPATQRFRGVHRRRQRDARPPVRIAGRVRELRHVDEDREREHGDGHAPRPRGKQGREQREGDAGQEREDGGADAAMQFLCARRSCANPNARQIAAAVEAAKSFRD